MCDVCGFHVLLSEVVSDCRSFVSSRVIPPLIYNGSREKWQDSFSRNGCYQEWLPPRNHGLQKADKKGLLLHYHSHVDARDKLSLLNTMLNHAFQLSSTWKFFHEECERLKWSSPDCAILTTLCCQPFADSLNQKCWGFTYPISW